jgi:putative oxidoreductase
MSTTTIEAGTDSTFSGLARRAIATDESIAPMLLRVTLGAVMFPHGAQKLLGWFGGYGFEGTMGFLTGQIGLPAILAVAVIFLEFFGSIALVLGLGTRAFAAGMIAIMAGAVATVHLQHGFFMNWSGAQGGEGFEYHLLVIGLSLALVVAGGGRWSIDGLLDDRLSD